MSYENIRAKMRGGKLNSYQEGLALDEFVKMEKRLWELEDEITKIKNGKCVNFYPKSNITSATVCIFCEKEKHEH